MVRRPFNIGKDRGIGPLSSSGSTEYPPEGPWAVNPEVAHWLWTHSKEAEYMNWGPDPPILLDAFMNFFPSRSQSEARNHWYFTRYKDKRYTDPDVWEKIPNKLRSTDGRESNLNHLFDVSTDTNPEKVSLISQQYTSSGAMFTYEIRQKQGEPASGMVRVPVPRGMEDRVKRRLDGPKSEYFEYQYREYRSQYGDPPEGMVEHYHPHFSIKNITDGQELIDFFERAFNVMEAGVRMEKS